jgi:membrane protein DedA with SNARE-associated domain
MVLALAYAGWWFDFDQIFGSPKGLWRATSWLLLVTVTVTLLAYRVWWKRRLPA